MEKNRIFMKRMGKLSISFVTIVLVLGTGFFLYTQKSAPSTDNRISARCNHENMSYLNSDLSIEERVNDLMGRMNDEEKIGQMALIEKNSIRNIDDITKYHLGALLSGGGAGPDENTPSAWLEMVNNYQAAAKKTCLGIPLLYGIDAVHGHGNVIGATIFPHAIGLGATRDADLVERVARATAKEMAATGIFWSYSPNLDVVKNYGWGKTYETFGTDTENVTKLGAAYLAGVQDTSHGYIDVVATAKHFVGGGAMEYGTSRNKDFSIEEGNFSLDEETLRKVHLAPFQYAVQHGLKSVMVGTARWNEVINPSNHYLITDVLKKEFGFSGFVVSDWYAVYLISPNKYDSTVTAINAGIDMVMTPFEYKDFISDMHRAIANGDIQRERMDDAVRRILKVKFEAGLFDRPDAEKEGLSVVGSVEHRELAREAVRKSQVFLKNNAGVLPLSKTVGNIRVAGSSADNMGRQAGGWTVEWQGVDGNSDIPGTTILSAIKKTVSSDTKIEYNQKGIFSENTDLADIGIAVVGEKPYAEGWGDQKNPRLSEEDLTTINNLKKSSKRVIVIMVSGRPLDIRSYSKDWDGIVVAWLPGSEGEGVTDVLFGDYAVVGTVPLVWDIE